MPKVSKTIWIQSLFKLSKSKYFTTLISLDSVYQIVEKKIIEVQKGNILFIA